MPSIYRSQSHETYSGKQIQKRINQATRYEFPVYEESTKNDVLSTLQESRQTQESQQNEDTPESERPLGIYLNRYYTVSEIVKILKDNKQNILESVKHTLEEDNYFGAEINLPSLSLGDEDFIKGLLSSIEGDGIKTFDEYKEIADSETTERLEKYFDHTVEKSLSPRCRAKLQQDEGLIEGEALMVTLKDLIVTKKVPHTVLPTLLSILDGIDTSSRKTLIMMLITAYEGRMFRENPMSKLVTFLQEVDDRNQEDIIKTFNSEAIGLDKALSVIYQVDAENFLRSCRSLNTGEYFTFIDSVGTEDFANFFGYIRPEAFVNLFMKLDKKDLIYFIKHVDIESFDSLVKKSYYPEYLIDSFLCHVDMENFVSFFNQVNQDSFADLIGRVNKKDFASFLNEVDDLESLIFFFKSRNINMESFTSFFRDVDTRDVIRLFNKVNRSTLERCFEFIDHLILIKICQQSIDDFIKILSHENFLTPSNFNAFKKFVSRKERLPRRVFGRYFY